MQCDSLRQCRRTADLPTLNHQPRPLFLSPLDIASIQTRGSKPTTRDNVGVLKLLVSLLIIAIIIFFPLLRRSEPYDPYLPRNGSSSNPAAGSSQVNPKTAAIQAQIDDTVGIMRDNITKVAERGERLETLQDKTGAL
jgi:hypothetical protein